MSSNWENYEEVAQYLLGEFKKEFGLAIVEGKQKVSGKKSGTDWEIDAKGVCENNEGIIVIECRHYAVSKLKQEQIAAIAYRVADIGAKGAIVVTPIGFQEGASKIAAAENIVEVKLDAESTTTSYVLQFLNKTMVGASMNLGVLFGTTFSAEIVVAGEFVEPAKDN